MHTKHTTENAAREAARAMGNNHVQIIESKDDKGNWVFFLELSETGGMIRSWERLAYSGKGRNARPVKELVTA